MKEIHIYTGGKGGVGKTIFSLSTLFYYKNKQKKVLLIDLNTTNPNLLHIFYNIKNDTIPFDDEGIQMRAIRFNENLYVSFPAKPHILPTETIINFYRSIKVAYEHLKKTEHFEPDAIIVDTNLNLANFWTESLESLIKIKNIYTPIIENYTPFHWHIWALSDFITVQETESRIINNSQFFPIISSALYEIKRVWGDNFNEKKNLINVLNIYSIYPLRRMEKSIQERLFFWDTNLNSGIKELAFFEKRGFSMNGISLEKLKILLMDNYKKILEEDLFKLSDKSSEMYEALGDAISKLAKDEEFEGKIPRNLLIIGTYRQNLVGFTDLKATKCDSISDVEKYLNPLPNIVSKYLSNLLETPNK